MSPTNVGDADKLAEEFIGYIADKYPDSRHVRRVGTWIGFILKAIERASDGDFGMHHTRQVTFRYGGKKFKARYNHRIRGVIEIVEVLQKAGSPDGDMALEVQTLADAETVYNSLEYLLDTFIQTGRPAPGLGSAGA